MDTKTIAFILIILIIIGGFIFYKYKQELKDKKYMQEDEFNQIENEKMLPKNFTGEMPNGEENRHPMENISEEELAIMEQCREDPSFCEDYCSENPEAPFCNIREEMN